MKHVFVFLAAMLLIASCGQPKFEFSLDANGLLPLIPEFNQQTEAE